MLTICKNYNMLGDPGYVQVNRWCRGHYIDRILFVPFVPNYQIRCVVDVISYVLYHSTV